MFLKVNFTRGIQKQAEFSLATKRKTVRMCYSFYATDDQFFFLRENRKMGQANLS